MARTLELTEQEATLVHDVIEWWLAGMEEAKTSTISDRTTLHSPELLLDAMDGLADQEQLCRSVLERLKNPVQL